MGLAQIPDPILAFKFLDTIPKRGSTKVIVLVRPTGKCPVWWPKDASKPGWATIDFSPSSGYMGYSMGRCSEMTLLAKDVVAAIRDLGITQMKENGKPGRRWEVKIEVIK